MSLSVAEVFTCNCKPGFNWKNKNTFKMHKASIRHKSYEKSIQEKTNRININKLQIELNRLELENSRLRELFLNSAKENMILKNKLKELN